jgi:hypothetical protein
LLELYIVIRIRIEVLDREGGVPVPGRATEYVNEDPAAYCEGVVGLVFAEFAGFFQEEEDGETGA